MEHALVGPGGWGWRVWGLGTNASKDPVWPGHPGGQATEPQQHQTPRAFHGWWVATGTLSPQWTPAAPSACSPGRATLWRHSLPGRALPADRRGGAQSWKLEGKADRQGPGLQARFARFIQWPGTAIWSEGCGSKPAGGSHAGQ